MSSTDGVDEAVAPSTLRVKIASFFVIFVAVAAVVLIAWVVIAGALPSECIIEAKYTRNLNALTEVSDSIHGNFWLGSGVINGVPKYILKEAQTDGGTYVRQILQGEAVTYQDVSKGAPWVSYKWEINKSTRTSCTSPDRPEAMSTNIHSWYEIHIPVGGIFENYPVTPPK